MDSLTPEECFNLVPACEIPYEGCPYAIAENSLGWTSMVTIYDADLSVDQARQLRDWLNKVLP